MSIERRLAGIGAGTRVPVGGGTARGPRAWVHVLGLQPARARLEGLAGGGGEN